MEEPLSAQKIERRDKCSKIQQILEKVMETHPFPDGYYLEMLNHLKVVYDQ